MPTLTVTKSYADNTVLTEAQLDDMKNSLETFFNTTGIDDTNIQPGGVGLASLATAVASSLCPPGSIIPYGGATAPTGWLLCDGSEVSTTTYAALNTVLAGAYNDPAPGGGNFRLPDLRGRAPVGADNMGGTAADRLDSMGADADDLGAFAGADTHQITEAELDAHSHTIDHGHPDSFVLNNAGSYALDGHSHPAGNIIARIQVDPGGTQLHMHSVGISTPWGSGVYGSNMSSNWVGGSIVASRGVLCQGDSGGNSTAASLSLSGGVTSHSGSSSETGSSSAHNNLQPLQIVNYIIKY